MNDSKGNEYHAMNNTIDKQLSSFNPKFTLSTANFRTLRVFPLQVLASSCLPQQILNFSSNLLTHFDTA